MSCFTRLLGHPLPLNAAFGWKCLVEGPLRYGRPQRYAPPSWRACGGPSPCLASLRVALIADEMTYQSFGGVCRVYPLSPKDWRDVMEETKPDVLFTESAWSGTAGQRSCWRYRVYRREGLWFDNRSTLRAILQYCREAGIPTVFWNKEDPTFFGSTAHDFADTAAWFGSIATTAEECIPKYRAMGCRDVRLMPFGCPAELFRPLPGEFDQGRAVFFGSWYADQPARCADMARMFDSVLGMGMRLEIYDRNHGSRSRRLAYPAKYRRHVRPGVPYEGIRAAIGRPCYALNINTATDSRTMYARRVHEMMACGCVVMSNDSPGLRERFGGRIWFLGEDFDRSRADEIRAANQAEVLRRDTWAARLRELFCGMGLLNAAAE